MDAAAIEVVAAWIPTQQYAALQRSNQMLHLAAQFAVHSMGQTVSAP